MKKKYYKMIIEQLEEKLDNKRQECKIIYNRMVEANKENQMLRKDLAELSKDFLKK